MIRMRLGAFAVLLAGAGVVAAAATPPLPIPASLPASAESVVVQRLDPDWAIVMWSWRNADSSATTEVEFHHLVSGAWTRKLHESLPGAYLPALDRRVLDVEGGREVLVSVQYGAAVDELRTYVMRGNSVTPRQVLSAGTWVWSHEGGELRLTGIPESAIDHPRRFRWSGGTFVADDGAKSTNEADR